LEDEYGGSSVAIDLAQSYFGDMYRRMATSSDKSGKGWAKTRSLSNGRYVATKSPSGRVEAHSSFRLPNGDRINTVRRDIMDRALGRLPEKKD